MNHFDVVRDKTKVLVYLLSTKDFDAFFKSCFSLVKRHEILEYFDNQIGYISVPSERCFNTFRTYILEENLLYRVEFRLWFNNRESDLTAAFEFRFKDDTLTTIEFRNLSFL